MAARYQFDGEQLFDLLTQQNVSITGEREAVFRRRGNHVLAFITDERVVAEFEADPDFDLNQYQADLLALPMEPPKFDYVVSAQELAAKNVRKLA